jgi:hypothetical protein
MADLFPRNDKKKGASYNARDIEVLEGLEPVRRRPGMYIGGTDEVAMHHLVAEVLDNAMDEAVTGHADRIDLSLAADNQVTVRDNGRGIPVDNHPKYQENQRSKLSLPPFILAVNFQIKFMRPQVVSTVLVYRLLMPWQKNLLSK